MAIKFNLVTLNKSKIESYIQTNQIRIKSLLQELEQKNPDKEVSLYFVDFSENKEFKYLKNLKIFRDDVTMKACSRNISLDISDIQEVNYQILKAKEVRSFFTGGGRATQNPTNETKGVPSKI